MKADNAQITTSCLVISCIAQLSQHSALCPLLSMSCSMRTPNLLHGSMRMTGYM